MQDPTLKTVPELYEYCLDNPTLEALYDFLRTDGDVATSMTQYQMVARLSRFLSSFDQEQWPDRIQLLYLNIVREAIQLGSDEDPQINKLGPADKEKLLKITSKPFYKLSEAKPLEAQLEKIGYRLSQSLLPYQETTYYQMHPHWKYASLNEFFDAKNYYRNSIEESMKPKIVTAPGRQILADDLNRVLKYFEKRYPIFGYVDLQIGSGDYVLSPDPAKYPKNLMKFATIINVNPQGVYGGHWVALFAEFVGFKGSGSTMEKPYVQIEYYGKNSFTYRLTFGKKIPSMPMTTKRL